jgi:hypothetical protein
MAFGRSKYSNKWTEVDGIKFQSKLEADRYIILKQYESEGVIQGLELQRSFKFENNGVKICDYRADFVYKYKGREIVEDAKGQLTDVFKLKRKMMKSIGIDIYISTSKTLLDLPA